MSPDCKNKGVVEQILTALKFALSVFTSICKEIILVWQKTPKKLRHVMIVIVAIVLLGSLVTCDAFKGEKIDWVNIRLGHVLPKPQSNRMDVWHNSDEELDIELYNISENQYYEYIRWCEDEKGFDVDVDNYSSSFHAYNHEGYYVTLYYTDYNEKMKIRLDAPREMSNYSFPDYAIESGLPYPKSQLGCYNWKNEDEFFLYIGNTTQEEYFEYKETCIDAGFKYEVYEYSTNYSAINEQGYKVTLGYEDYYTFSIRFSCPDKVEMTSVSDPTPTITEDEKVIMPTEEYVIECLGCVPNVIEIEAVTEGNDPNNKLNKEKGYYSAVFFAVDLLNQNEVYGDNLIEKGTDAGGCVESYKSVEDAKARDEYLSNFDDNTVFNSGSHKVIGTIVVRTSKELTKEEQHYLESNIIVAITGGEIQESIQPNEGEELTEDGEVPVLTPTPTPTLTSTPTPTPTLTLTPEPIVEGNISIDNNKEFASLMKIKDQTDAKAVKKFVNAHVGDIIEFDGCIAFMMNHKNYKTRFDVCMAGGDYDAPKVYGPLFAFEDVNYYNMNVSGSDTVATGMDFRITAEIVEYSDDGGYILLKPISMVAR